MAFNVGSFRAELVGGGARPTLFEILVPGLQKFSMMCKAAQLPGRTITPIEIPYFGRMYKVPGDTVFNDWTVTIINDEDFMCRDYLENWMNQINTHVTNVSALPPRAEQTNLDVIQYGKDGTAIKSYKFIHAWPTEVAEIEVGWENQNQIEEYVVTFTYSWWEARSVETTKSGLYGSNPIPFVS